MASDPQPGGQGLTVIARRDDGAVLARLGDGECAVIIGADGSGLWATSVMSALSRGDWERDDSALDEGQQRAGMRAIDERIADGLLDCDRLAEIEDRPSPGSPGLPGIRPEKDSQRDSG